MRVQPFAFIGGGATPFFAEGGEVGTFTSGGLDYKYHKFTASAQLNVIQGTNSDVRVLVVGGGAGGDTTNVNENGGGAGGVIYSSSVYLQQGIYNVSVASSVGAATNGQTSSFSGTALSIEAGGGLVTGVSGTPQSNAAGLTVSCGGTPAGGGGAGAGAAGSDGFCVPTTSGGAGGNGLLIKIGEHSTSSFAAGGGGGSNQNNTAGAGGTTGGGIGGSANQTVQSGSFFGAGGGGQGNFGGGGAGAGGVVYVQYTTAGTQTPYFVTDGLQFMVDAGSGSSYPGSGTTWSDLSGNGYDATLVGSPTFTSNASASYFSFNGSSQYATFTPPLAAGDATYSYFAIFYPNVNETKMILYQGNEATNRRGAMIMCDSGITPPNGGLGFNGFANDSISGCGGVVPVSLSNWQTFSFTLDEVAATPFNLYKNGALSASGSATGTTTDLNLGTNAARIAANGSNGENFNGRIAVCMMYNRVLTADEIKQNHNYFAGRYGLATV